MEIDHEVYIALHEPIVSRPLEDHVMADPVGVVEVADRLHVKRGTVDAWRARSSCGFPPPRWTVGGRPAWDWADIAAWASSTGRGHPVLLPDGSPQTRYNTRGDRVPEWARP